MVFRFHLRRRTRILAAALLLLAIGLGGWYIRSQHIPDPSAAIGPPPAVFHDPRLDVPVTITFEGVKFTDAVHQLADCTGVRLHIDNDVPADTEIVRVYFNGCRLPARTIWRYLLSQARPYADLIAVEKPDGLHLVRFADFDEPPTTQTLDIHLVLDEIERRNTEPGPGVLRQIWVWCNRQIGRDIDSSVSVFSLLSSVGLRQPPTSVGAAIAQMYPLGGTDPLYCTAYPLIVTDWKLSVQAIPQAQASIYRTVAEIHLGVMHGIDSVRIHQPDPQRLRALQWMNANNPVIGEKPVNLAMLFKQATQRQISISVHDDALRRVGLAYDVTLQPPSDRRSPRAFFDWLREQNYDLDVQVSQVGVVLITSHAATDDWTIIRTYNVSDLMDAVQPEELERLPMDESPVRVESMPAPAYPLTWEEKRLRREKTAALLSRMIEVHVLRPHRSQVRVSMVDTLLLVKATADEQDRVSEFLKRVRRTLK